MKKLKFLSEMENMIKMSAITISMQHYTKISHYREKATQITCVYIYICVHMCVCVCVCALKAIK